MKGIFSVQLVIPSYDIIDGYFSTFQDDSYRIIFSSPEATTYTPFQRFYEKHCIGQK